MLLFLRNKFIKVSLIFNKMDEVEIINLYTEEVNNISQLTQKEEISLGKKIEKNYQVLMDYLCSYRPKEKKGLSLLEEEVRKIQGDNGEEYLEIKRRKETWENPRK